MVISLSGHISCKSKYSRGSLTHIHLFPFPWLGTSWVYEPEDLPLVDHFLVDHYILSFLGPFFLSSRHSRRRVTTSCYSGPLTSSVPVEGTSPRTLLPSSIELLLIKSRKRTRQTDYSSRIFTLSLTFFPITPSSSPKKLVSSILKKHISYKLEWFLFLVYFSSLNRTASFLLLTNRRYRSGDFFLP